MSSYDSESIDLEDLKKYTKSLSNEYFSLLYSKKQEEKENEKQNSNKSIQLERASLQYNYKNVATDKLKKDIKFKKYQ